MKKVAGKEIGRVFVNGVVFGVGILCVGLLTTGILALSRSNGSTGLYIFDDGDTVSASHINHNFAVSYLPVGSIVAWHKSLPNMPALNIDAADPVWVECNGGTVSNVNSPINGQPIPNLNSAPNAYNAGGVFLRGGTTTDPTSSVFQGDQGQGHTHVDSGHTHRDRLNANFGGFDAAIGGGAFTQWSTASEAGYASLGLPTIMSHGTPRYGDETRPVNFRVVWIMKIR